MKKKPAYLGLLAVLVVTVLVVLRATWISDYSQKKLDFAQANNEKLIDLFQSSFYFYFDDQFKPAIESLLKANPDLTQVMIISGSGQVAFNSADLKKGKSEPYRADARLLPEHAQEGHAILLPDADGIGVLTPSRQYSIYYVFSLRTVNTQFLILLTILIGGLSLAAFGFYQWKQSQEKGPIFRLNSLTTKFVGTMVALNAISGAILYVSQSHHQKQELIDRMIKTSVLLGELTKENVISSFSNYFYFYYQDKFVPAIRHIMSSKENLSAIRIVSKKAGTVVFDSDEMDGTKRPGSPVETKRADFSEDALSQLKTNDTFSEVVRPQNGEPYIRVISTYRSETQEAQFYVEYIFSFASLNARLAAVQKQIVVELLPEMLLGLLVALLFARLVLGPIRRLVKATNAITGGNYDVMVDSDKKDELGDLMRSFNSMAFELRRKNELKKYLSEHSYRRITEGSETMTTASGARVRATVLFCDIRNFVNVCEALDAEEVTSLLNEYFSNMVEVIYKHRGEIDKFIGDALLAVFYDNEDSKTSSNTALHAIYCAMEMRERLKEFNVKRQRNSQAPVDIGIGINSGEIISGPIGSPDRMDFTVIGDVVNLASRIEKLSKQGRHTRIVFSNRVEEKVRGLLDYEELTREKIRGKEEEVTVYELVQIKDVSELLKNLEHPEPSIKKHCIELLGYSRNIDALPAVYSKLTDPNDDVRAAAVSSVTRLAPKNHPESLDILFKLLETDKSQKVISTILIGLGRVCRSERILQVSRFLQDKDERIVANAIEALGTSEEPKVIDLLIPFVSSRNNRVKANAAMVLFSKGRVEVLDTLKPMLLNSDAMMRASAAFALGELTLIATAENLANRLKGDNAQLKHFLGELQSCVPLLVSLLKDADPMVKRHAIVALGKIKDKSAVLPLLDNINVDTDSKEIMREVAEALRSIGSHRLVREVVKQLS